MQMLSSAVWSCVMACFLVSIGYGAEPLVPAAPGTLPEIAAPLGPADLPADLQQAAAALDKDAGSTLIQQAKIMAADGVAGDECGYAAALSSDGNTALIGAPYADLSGSSNQGAAYVFTRSGDRWSQQQKLTAEDFAGNDIFGYSVALSSDGNTALIGAPNAEVNGNVYQGAAYIFVRYLGHWVQQKKLAAEDGAAGHLFGYAVALSAEGSNALVGATWGMITNQGAGGYIFTRGSGWNQQAKLTAADGVANDSFGAALALSGDGNTAVIGAPNARSGVITGVGAAYIYTCHFGNWSQQAKLTAGDGTQGAHFGNAAALNGNGNTVLIGAYSAIAGANMPGAAYVFTRALSSWSQQAKLTAADGASWTDFGYSLALSGSGDTALVGAPDAYVSGAPDSGAAYLFKRSGNRWSQHQKLTAADGAANDDFGMAVALSGSADTALVSAYYPRSVSWKQKKGAGYVFAAADVPPAGPVIKANGTRDNAVVNYPAPVTITVEMNAGIYAGVGVDWWVVACSRAGQWFYLNNAMQWTPFGGNLAECRPVYQGALFDLPATAALDSYVLPRGTYDCWFAVDYPMDGVLNLAGQFMSDQVTVLVQ